MKISKTGLDFIKSFESFVPYVYDDKVAPIKGRYREWKGEDVRGTLTIGYGHTDAAKHPLRIAKGVKISEAEACKILDVDLDECEAAVSKLVKVPINQGQFDALASLTFNMGEGNLARSSLLARLNRGDYRGARAAFDLYVKSKGEVMRGLQRRRDGEQALWDAVASPLPTHPVDHPAEVDVPAQPKLKDVIADSRKATWISRLTKALHAIWMSLGLGSVMEWLDASNSVLDQVSEVVRNNALALAIGGAILGALALKYVLALMVEDVKDGRSTPSGTTN